jgi:hypothetical protein
MKQSFMNGLLVLSACVFSVSAQGDLAQPEATPTPVRVIVTNTMPPIQPARTPVPAPSNTIVVPSAPSSSSQTYSQPSQASNLNYKGLSFAQIKSKIAEAKRMMQTRPLTTAMSEPLAMTSLVRIAYYDWRTKNIDFIVLDKDTFLTAGVLTMAVSSNGRSMTVRTIRANGVNTPIVITDETGQAHLPLLAQYPVEKGGRFIETAYYISTHPGLVTPEVVNAGRFYVRNVVDIAREQLRVKGYFIQPKVADIAERLATVEHVDHFRFRTEFHANIYNDIYTLFALNEGQTYRYSVSSAGAGGMVQMIPSTYRMVRSRYPNALLMPDFVEGMRNHVNASQAMLLYMQMTWNDLIASPTVYSALQNGIATQEQLMAAGYNSNPARLAGYINRGGASWSYYIPRETKIYLQIYASIERAVSQTPRKQ